ncbi:MAG TPA: hypothetical protein VHI77_11870 [Solirubrobacterales bacterium]|jgi:hypothetical protein|nr:hypothetical protein [Solirubrobacterales bacterium]
MAEGTPFPYAGPIPSEQLPEALIDRERELQLLGRRAGDRVAVRLQAPRRYGKTSLLRVHIANLDAASWRTAYVDFDGVADISDVARRLALAYGDQNLRWMRSRLGSALTRLGLSIGAEGGVRLEGERRRDPAAAEQVVYELLDMPLRVSERTGEPTLVVFDEFQELLTAREDLDALVRSRIQHHGEAATYVYAGSQPSLMRALFDERSRPLYGQADPLELGPLDLGELTGALADRFEIEDLDPGEALGALVGFAEGHPQRTMMLAYHLAERLAEGESGTSRLGEEVVTTCVEKTAPEHAATWRALTRRGERPVLTALASGLAATSRKAAAEHRLSHDALAEAAHRLENAGHLARAGRGWRFVDPLFADWLRRR